VAVKGALTAALLFAAGGSSRLSPAVAARHRAPHASDAATISEYNAMIDQIRELVRFLSRDSLSVEDVVGRVGPVINDPGGLMPVELQPVLDGVRAANLGRNSDNGLPYVLTLELTPGSGLTAATLRQAFGDYKRLRTERGQPPEIIFYPPPVGSRWKVALIADLRSVAAELDDQPVTGLSLRRDPVSR
jgi:hypothetical protein